MRFNQQVARPQVVRLAASAAMLCRQQCICVQSPSLRHVLAKHGAACFIRAEAFAVCGVCMAVAAASCRMCSAGCQALAGGKGGLGVMHSVWALV
jgi:hypothetical protein